MFTFTYNSSTYHVKVVAQDDHRFEMAQSLVSSIYYEIYQAVIKPKPDLFVICTSGGKKNDDEQIFACAGLTFGRSHKILYSEYYLDHPIETIFAHTFGDDIDRDDLVEVGSFASRDGVVGKELTRLIPIVAWLLGMRAIVCTATTKLRKTLERQKVPFKSVVCSDIERLPASEQSGWGTYYNSEPQTGLIPLNVIGHLFESSCGRYTYSENNGT